MQRTHRGEARPGRVAAKPNSINEVLWPGEIVEFSYSCAGNRESLHSASDPGLDDWVTFQGRIYFTPRRLIWISEVRETGLNGWLDRHLFYRNELRGMFDIPLESIRRIEIEEDFLRRWVQTFARIFAGTTVFVFFMGSGPLGLRLAQTRAAAKAARFIQEMNPAVTVEKL